jgi:serine/threonine protein kinase
MEKLSERSIFLNAIEYESPIERQHYLDKSCGDDRGLRDSVNSLLAAHDAPENRLDAPPVAFTNLSHPETHHYDWSIPDHVGQTIGSYRLMEQIGEGGFGLVFVAQQLAPVKRKVALKIVKPGTGTKEVIARFEAERQAVAMMEHPNIARIFDAGITSDGRPYFVMELVRGVPLTEFADSQRMSLRDRLAMFSDVCSAVQHAHQKGIIHRDLKPSNVMITLHDGKPVVKVIDFGVAKAIGQSLTEKTIYTRFFSMIGTPLYMSPEQAEMSGLDVDTRSDIYSLGVMLYELLVGTTPFDRQRLDSAGLDEMRRIIREEEPPRPSRRSTLLGDRCSTISEARSIDPNRLSTTLRGDLDWIVMKALSKDRTLRYESASALATDVQRHLNQQPIEARPPTLFYQLSKFTRRNKAGIATLSLITLTMLVGTIVSLWQMMSAIEQRDQKEQALLRIEQFAEKVTLANELVASAQTNFESGRWDAAAADFDSAVEQQPSYYLPWVARAQFRARSYQWHLSADDFEVALSLGSPIDSPQWSGAAALMSFTDHKEAAGKLGQLLEPKITSALQHHEWEMLRNCAAAGQRLSLDSWTRLAKLSDDWLAQRDGPNANFGSRPRRQRTRSIDPSNKSSSAGDAPFERRSLFPPFFSRQFSERPPGPPPAKGERDGRARGDRQPWQVCFYVSGLTHLRMQDFEVALERLSKANDDKNWPSVGLTYAPMAIAYHELGNQERASRMLSKSREAIIDIAKRKLAGEDPRRQTPWFDLVELLAIYTEAVAAIEGRRPEPIQELDALREQARL